MLLAIPLVKDFAWASVLIIAALFNRNLNDEGYTMSVVKSEITLVHGGFSKVLILMTRKTLFFIYRSDDRDNVIEILQSASSQSKKKERLVTQWPQCTRL